MDDYLGIRPDPCHDDAPVIMQLKAKALNLADQAGLLSAQLVVNVKRLPSAMRPAAA